MVDSLRRFGPLAVLFLVLAELKLAGVSIVATWSWWRITGPLWAPFVVGLAALLACWAMAVADRD